MKSPDQRAAHQAGEVQQSGQASTPVAPQGSSLPPLTIDTGASAPADRSRLRALARLLGDESRIVRDELRRHFHDAGKIGRPALRHAARSSDPRIRGHARTLLLELDRAAVRRRLLSFAARSSLDLEAGLFVLGRLHDPGLDARPYRRALDAFADEVLRRSVSCGTELERAEVLADYLGKTVGFSGSVEDYHHPDHVHLHRVIETRTGLPLTLCAIYVFVARRIGLRASVLPLPGHVMLRLHGLRSSRIIDPFHAGRTRSQAALTSYLAKHNLGFDPRWFRAAGEKSLFLRQVNNLIQTYSERGFPAQVETLLDVLEVGAHEG